MRCAYHDNKVSKGTHEDTESSPYLPGHDETSTDIGGDDLGAIDTRLVSGRRCLALVTHDHRPPAIRLQ